MSPVNAAKPNAPLRPLRERLSSEHSEQMQAELRSLDSHPFDKAFQVKLLAIQTKYRALAQQDEAQAKG